MERRTALKIIGTVMVIMSCIIGSCRKDSGPEKPSLNSMKFEVNKLEMYVGDRKNVKLTLEPKEASKNVKVVYSVTDKSVIALDENASSNDGVVFEAIAPGSTVIMAKANGVNEYIDITVNDDNEINIPYITLTDSVLEIPLGKKKHVSAMLQGGNQADLANFTFVAEKETSIYLEYANNTGIIEGIAPGACRVTVAHPKAQYSVDIVCFVIAEGETAQYITGENVVFMDIVNATREYEVRMVGIEDYEKAYCLYKVVSGNDIVSVIGSGSSCTIKALAEGIAKVSVSHQKLEYPFEFQVVVRGKPEVSFITTHSNYYLLSGGEYATLNFFINRDADDYLSDFKWELDAENIVSINQVQNTIVVQALHNGTVKLTVTNKYSDFPCEVLFVVHESDFSIEGQEKYIRTSQQVIQMEKGGPDAKLLIELVGGTQADHNNFEWVVEDSSIISVAAPGNVRNRSMVQVTSTVEALITAKKVGVTRILVSNPGKAANDLSVLVKVYPKGTFYGKALSLSGPSIIRLATGSETHVYTPIVGGNAQMLGNTLWESGNETIAHADGSYLNGSVQGFVQGITTLIVSGDNIVNPYQGIVMVYEPGQEDSIQYIYSDHLRYDLPVGATVRIPIYHPNTEDNDFYMDVNKSGDIDSLFIVKQGNVILANGAELGQCVLCVQTNNTECNTLDITINVVSDTIDIDRPYSLSGENFLGIALGQPEGTYSYKVNMAGADVSEYNRLMFTIENNNIARIVRTAGGEAVIAGVNTGQTILRINHGKSVNEKSVIVYVVPAGENPANTIIIGAAQSNYVLYPYQSVFVRLLTNASEEDKKLFQWTIDNDTILNIDQNYDSAMITALNEGNAKITVTHQAVPRKHLIDLDLFVTVKGVTSIKPELAYPDSVVVVKNQSKIIKGNAVNISSSLLGTIQYNFENDNIARVTPNGLEATIQGLSSGQTFLTVTCDSINYTKKILVICVDSEVELLNLYYFTLNKYLYRVKKGESIKLKLNFGENGFPENALSAIDWRNTVSGDTVRIDKNRSEATITGRNAGVAVIEISCPGTVATPIKITVEVSDVISGNDYYWFVYSPIHQMSTGLTEMVPLSIYYDNVFYEDENNVLTHGNKLENGYSGITHTVDNPNIVEVGIAGDQLRINTVGKQPGRTVVTLHHELIQEDARILVVVYDGPVPPEGEYILFAPNTHWLINKGESCAINLEANKPEIPSSIFWHNHNPDLISIENIDKLHGRVTALKSGSAVITIENPAGTVVETLYIGVALPDFRDVSVATESIIILSMNDNNYSTRLIVSGGLSTGYIQWKAVDDTVVDIEGNFSTAYIYPKKVGITELMVTGPGFERTIIVKVVAVESERIGAKLINLDQRSFRLAKGQSITLSPYYKVIQPSNKTVQVIPVYDNHVIDTAVNDNKVVVTGKNIGIERIKIRNELCENKEIELTFEVVEELTGTVSTVNKVAYMVIDTPYIRLSNNTFNNYISLSVLGEYQGNSDDFIWSVENNDKNITINGFGNAALISTGSQNKVSVIRVHNQYCVEDLLLSIAVGPYSMYESMTEPYMYTEKTVYSAVLGEPALRIPLEVRNVGTVQWNAVQYYTNHQYINVRIESGTFIIEPQATGTDILHINYPGINRELVLYIAVTSKNGTSAVFLTTSQNYIILNQNKTQLIDISLVGYTEPDASNFRWSSENSSICYVVGSGRTVQAVGVSPGITKLFVEHIGNPKALNILEIMVKVLPPGSAEQACYLTTNDNVIETYVGSQNGQITVNKIGGTSGLLETTWSIDNPSVANVMGSGNIAYYTIKKSGTAKITVTDKEAGTLSVVLIVRQARPGSQYLFTSESVVLMPPGTSNKVISVGLSDGEESDEKDFKWQIYGHLPSDPEISKAGGAVVSLYGMGNKATVNSIYAGTAKLKITHPKAAEALFITVLVSNNKTLEFGQNEITVCTGDVGFVTLKVPEWENYSDKVRFSTNNADVCTILGTHRVAMLSGIAVGTTTVNAYLQGTDLSTSLKVNVVNQYNYDEPVIYVSKTMYVLTPREQPIIIDAQLFGAGLEITDNDKLEWKIYNMDKTKPMIKMFPEPDTDDGDHNGTYVPHSKGHQIMIEVQNYKDKTYIIPEACTIEITCPDLSISTKRTIFITVQEDSNAFRISKTDIKMESHQMEELSCTIAGGKNSDYDEVLWVADRDSFDPTKEIVRVMGKGKNVQLMGMADGVVSVMATYRGITKTCRVTIKSQLYFNINYQTFGCYPGQRVVKKNSNGEIIEETDPYFEYEVRPVSAYVSWVSTDSKEEYANIYKMAAVDKEGTGIGRVYVHPLKEGRFTIMGMSGHNSAKVDIIVSQDYSFRVGTNIINLTPWDYKFDKNNNDKSTYDKKVSSHSVNFTVSTGICNIQLKDEDKDYSKRNEYLKNGIDIIIEKDAVSISSGFYGTGKIIFKTMKEITPYEEIEFELLTADGKKSTGITRKITVYCSLPLKEKRLVPVYESIKTNYSGPQAPILYNNGSFMRTKLQDKTTRYNNAQNEFKIGNRLPTGMMVYGGYYLNSELLTIDADSIKDEYSIIVGDGEEFYILLDKVNEDADIQIINAIEQDLINQNNKEILPKAKLEDMSNGLYAIRVSGGKDYIVYDRVSSDFNLEVALSSTSTGVRVTKEVTKYPTAYTYTLTDFLAKTKIGTNKYAWYYTSDGLNFTLGEYNGTPSSSFYPNNYTNFKYYVKTDSINSGIATFSKVGSPYLPYTESQLVYIPEDEETTVSGVWYPLENRYGYSDILQLGEPELLLYTQYTDRYDGNNADNMTFLTLRPYIKGATNTYFKPLSYPYYAGYNGRIWYNNYGSVVCLTSYADLIVMPIMCLDNEGSYHVINYLNDSRTYKHGDVSISSSDGGNDFEYFHSRTGIVEEDPNITINSRYLPVASYYEYGLRKPVFDLSQAKSWPFYKKISHLVFTQSVEYLFIDLNARYKSSGLWKNVDVPNDYIDNYDEYPYRFYGYPSSNSTLLKENPYTLTIQYKSGNSDYINTLTINIKHHIRQNHCINTPETSTKQWRDLKAVTEQSSGLGIPNPNISNKFLANGNNFDFHLEGNYYLIDNNY